MAFAITILVTLLVFLIAVMIQWRLFYKEYGRKNMVKFIPDALLRTSVFLFTIALGAAILVGEIVFHLVVVFLL